MLEGPSETCMRLPICQRANEPSGLWGTLSECTSTILFCPDRLPNARLPLRSTTSFNRSHRQRSLTKYNDVCLGNLRRPQNVGPEFLGFFPDSTLCSRHFSSSPYCSLPHSRPLLHVNIRCRRTTFTDRHNPKLQTHHAARTWIIMYRFGGIRVSQSFEFAIFVEDFIRKHMHRTDGVGSCATLRADCHPVVQRNWKSSRQLIRTDAASAHPRWTSEEREALQELVRLQIAFHRLRAFIIIAAAEFSAWMASEWTMSGKEQRTGTSGLVGYTQALLSEEEVQG